MKGLCSVLVATALFAAVEGAQYAEPDAVGDAGYLARAKKERNYNVGVTDAEINDIKFIVLTLGNVPVIKLKKYEGQLKSAGDRVDHVHPLNFWRIIFSDSKMTSAMHSIKRRPLVWGKFIKGTGESLDEERVLGNLHDALIADFTSRLQVPFAPIAAPLHNRNWKEFVKQLLDHVPREDDADRYDL